MVLRRLAMVIGSGGLALAAACGQGQPQVRAIEPAELAARIEAGDAPLVLDVRTQEEFESGHIPGAVLVPHRELGVRLDELGWPRDAEIVVHCERGGRAAEAEEILREAGYTRVRDLDGHMSAWREGGYPVE